MKIIDKGTTYALSGLEMNLYAKENRGQHSDLIIIQLVGCVHKRVQAPGVAKGSYIQSHASLKRVKKFCRMRAVEELRSKRLPRERLS